MADAKKSRKKALEPTGLLEVDRLADLSPPTLQDYIAGVSAYVLKSNGLKAGRKKAGQIRLSNALGRALVADLQNRLIDLKDAIVGETKVSGALRTVNADVSQTHSLDGLRLAIEIKPVNLAVGRALWNRFGDIRTFAVNLHLKFPFAVIGGVLVVPTIEDVGSIAAKEATAAEIEGEEEEEEIDEVEVEVDETEPRAPRMRSTKHLIDRAIKRLVRAGGRKTEGDAPHLIEGIAVVAYDPQTSTIDPDLPPAGSRLRWDEFVEDIVTAYASRFELIVPKPPRGG